MSTHIALFGGSFNPPHQGHVAVVKELIKKDQFDEIWVLPVFNHPWGKEMVCFEDRLSMCHLAFDFLGPQIKVSDAEKENPTGHTLSLLQKLKKNSDPHIHFFWVMGSDQKAKTKDWKDFDQIEKLVQIYEIARAGYSLSTLPEVSSSEIRELVKGNAEQLLKKLPLGVYNYIKKRKLYL